MKKKWYSLESVKRDLSLLEASNLSMGLENVAPPPRRYSRIGNEMNGEGRR